MTVVPEAGSPASETGGAPAPVDTHTLAALVAEAERVRLAGQRLLLQPLLPPPPEPDGLDPAGAALLGVLVRLRALVVASPAAGQALLSFLVAEGRRWAATEEGAPWLELLAGDPQVAALRNLVGVATFDLLDGGDGDGEGVTVPPAWAHLLADALRAGDLDAVLGRLVAGERA